MYWSEDGRTSVDAVFAAVAVAGLLILGFNPLSFFDIGIWREDHTLAARAVGRRLWRCCHPGAGGGRAAQGQGVDGSGRHVHHPAAARRRDPAVAPARAVGALALHRQAAQDAPGAGAGTRAAPAGGAGQAVAAARHRRRAAVSPTTPRSTQQLDREIHAAPAPPSDPQAAAEKATA